MKYAIHIFFLTFIYSCNSQNNLEKKSIGIGTGDGSAVAPVGKFLIVSGDTSAKGYIYQIDDATGTISQIGNEITLGGSNPRTIEIIPLSAVE